MKFHSILKSSHDLKKNGYKVIRKLHKMENSKGANRAYSAAFNDTYFFILGCRALFDIIKEEYPDAEQFAVKCDTFLSYMESIAQTKRKMDKTVLAGFLHSYTKFFNNIIEKKVDFTINREMIELWNINCLMAYIATWGRNN